MQSSISPKKHLFSPKGETSRFSEDHRRVLHSHYDIPAPSIYSPPRQGKKIDESRNIQIELADDSQYEKPKFPIRIPIEQMKPRKNYLTHIRKSETNFENRAVEAQVKNIERRTIEPTKNKSQKDLREINKRYSLTRTESAKPKSSSVNQENPPLDPKNLKKIIENIVDYKFRTYVGGNAYNLERKNNMGNLSMDTAKKVNTSPKRPMSSRPSNKYKDKYLQSNRTSAKKPLRNRERLSQTLSEEPIDPEELRKEKMQKLKRIVIENLQKYHKDQKEKEEKLKQQKLEEMTKKEHISEMNKQIRAKNEKHVHRSSSPIKHKYGWGVDQKRLEQKPERKESAKKWEKKDDHQRRHEMGLAFLNEMQERELKKARLESKKKILKAVKEIEEMYALKKKKEKSEEEREKLKHLVHHQMEKNKKQYLRERSKKAREKVIKKKKLEALQQTIQEIKAKEEAEKLHEAHHQKKKVVRKKPKKTLPEVIDEDISDHHHHHHAKEKNEYEDEEFEEDIHEIKHLNSHDLYLLEDILERVGMSIQANLMKMTVAKLKAYAFSEQVSKRCQAKVQKRSISEDKSVRKEQTEKRYVEKKVIDNKKVIESERNVKKNSNYDEDDDYEEHRYGRKPLKENNNYARATTSIHSVVEKETVKLGSSQKKKVGFVEEEDTYQENYGYKNRQNNKGGFENKKEKNEEKVGYGQKGAEQSRGYKKENFYAENNPKPVDMNLEGADFDDLLFNLSSEELIRLPYFSIVK